MSRVVSNKLKTVNAIGSADGIADRQQQAVSHPARSRSLDQSSDRNRSRKEPRFGDKHKALLPWHAATASGVALLDKPTPPGGALRPSSLGQISSAIKASGTKAIFADKLPASKTMRRISRSSGVPIASKPLYSEGTAPGAAWCKPPPQRLHLRDGPGRSMQQEQAERNCCSLGRYFLILTHIRFKRPNNISTMNAFSSYSKAA